MKRCWVPAGGEGGPEHEEQLKQHSADLPIVEFLAFRAALSARIKVWLKRPPSTCRGEESTSNSTSFFSPILGGHVELLPGHPLRVEASVEEKDWRDEHQVDPGHPQTHVLVLREKVKIWIKEKQNIIVLKVWL